MEGRVVTLREANDASGNVFLSEPFEVGTMWSRWGDDTCQIVDVKTSLSVPAGEFQNCLKVSLRTGGEEGFFYFAPGVGLVKQINPGQMEAMQLLSYDLK